MYVCVDCESFYVCVHESIFQADNVYVLGDVLLHIHCINIVIIVVIISSAIAVIIILIYCMCVCGHFGCRKFITFPHTECK